MTAQASNLGPADLEGIVDETIVACGGDMRDALRTVLVALGHLQATVDRQDTQLARLAADISRGYSRGRWERAAAERTRVAGGGRERG